MRPGPGLEAAAAVDNVGRPPLQAAHADGGEKVDLALKLDLDAALVVLPRREEEGAVEQGVAVKDGHEVGADDAGHPVHLVGGERGEDEDAGLVVADAALVLHLKEKSEKRAGERCRILMTFRHSCLVRTVSNINSQFRGISRKKERK
jgi:hypothetical protein